jgi:3-isopropylmalate dehydratase small subunit
LVKRNKPNRDGHLRPDFPLNQPACTVVISDADLSELTATAAANPERPITVNLERQIIACGNREYAFSIDPVSRNQLTNG